MNILLVGSGGREHALAWKLAQSRICDHLFASPGNPGIAQHAVLATIDVGDHAAVLQFCEDKRIGLVVVGPEAPLVDGLADSLRGAGVPVFGPSRAAAQLEGSKAFTKELCARHQIPTAAFKRATTSTQALHQLDSFTIPVVIKADGLAAGKGVTVAMTRAEAEAAIEEIFSGKFGAAGAEAVIEEFADAYLAGATPVPCIRCNERVKFKDLLATAKDLNADCMATGHYIQRKVGTGAELHMATDPNRDQSYFLFSTTPEQLDYLRFPLGHLASKAETRALAARYGLAVLLDQKIRAEGVLRTIYLYPMALSFIVTGTAWKWLLNPGMGIEKASSMALRQENGDITVLPAHRACWRVRPIYSRICPKPVKMASISA